MIEDVAPMVVSPWLPTRRIPYAGAFVLDFARYLEAIYTKPPQVIHLDDTFRAESRLSAWLSRRVVAQYLLLDRSGRQVRSIRIPIPVPRGSGWVERSQVSRSLGRALRPGTRRLQPATTRSGSSIDVHAHVGIVSGSLVHSWPEGSYRLFVYEHASFIVALLQQDASARAEYARTVARAQRVFCVNPTMVEAMQNLFPRSHDKFRFHPNAVDFGRFDRKERAAPLTRWLYVGNLKPSKGTRRLLDAFEMAMDRWGDVSLTVVGSGIDGGWLESHRFEKAVQLLPPLPPRQIPEVMSEGDLLVHLSEGETFGLTCLEAIAAGMPVLATSTEGSETTIRPVIDEAGTLLDQNLTPDDVVEAYGELRDLPPRLDLESARDHLQTQFAPRSVADRLAEELSQLEYV